MLMTLGYTVLMSEGLLSRYCNMNPKHIIERHRVCMISSAIVLGLGLVAIICNKVFVKGSSAWPHSVHSYGGFLFMVGIVGQSAVGSAKFSFISRNVKKFR